MVTCNSSNRKLVKGFVCFLLLISSVFLITGNPHYLPQYKEHHPKESSDFKRQHRTTSVGDSCDEKILSSYSNFHAAEKTNKHGKFLIYHVLDDDVVGLGCRMSAALYALALSMHTKRVLILGGDEFKYIYSKYINFTDAALINCTHMALRQARVGETLSLNNRTYVKIEVAGKYKQELNNYFFSNDLSHVDVLYTNSLASHRHIDKLMAEDIFFRETILKIFGQDLAKFGNENRALLSQNRYKLVPGYPTVWRQIWGCAQWFLFSELHHDLEHEINYPFLRSEEPCEKLVSIHFRGGDTSFSEQLSGRERTKDIDIEKMVDRWSKRIRTPLEAAELYFLYAKQLGKGWIDVKVCYFIATDDVRVIPIASQKLGDNVFVSSGLPAHSSLTKSKNATIKALADYFLLGMGDGLVHGMSTLSESAIERSFGKNLEVKCRSPQKKFWADVKSWYCIQKGKGMDRRARIAIEYVKRKSPKILN